MATEVTSFWAKTCRNARGEEAPGISVRDHCLNVGWVAHSLAQSLPTALHSLLPGAKVETAALLAALHDIGKITPGFQIKCSAWQVPPELGEGAIRLAAQSVSDHARVSQVYLQDCLKSHKAQLWAAAIGAHHGRPKGRTTKIEFEMGQEWAEVWRRTVAGQLMAIFGPLPTSPPNPELAPAHSDLWFFAGLVTVADWIGSNEFFFPPDRGLSVEESRCRALNALATIGWPGGKLIATSFTRAFTGLEDSSFQANGVQQAVSCAEPGLVILEAPMGCGKTEAALHLAQKWIVAGDHHGFYFALPTQVTSNRIHQRVAGFLRHSLADPARFRLAHSHAWLEESYDLALEPAHSSPNQDAADQPDADIREARSWFSSAKHALLAPYGVGTIDQALQGMVTVKHFFVRRFALAGKIVILDEIHSYDIYTGTLVGALVGELLNLGCSVIVLSATLTAGRRQELLMAAGCAETVSPTAYPLVTCAQRRGTVRHLQPQWSTTKTVHLRTEAMEENAVLDELIARAEQGQHVLWIRNTVIEAQKSFAALRGRIVEGTVCLGLLHSRFPFVRRQELEGLWLERLGRGRAPNGPGSILIATQVVEQSVDIDLDFIVSDLAPTDMLIQRLGRLWRHDRPGEDRAAKRPDFWVRVPMLDGVTAAGELKAALGRSARVYAPYVLLRSLQVWGQRGFVRVPEDIRPMLEATYAEAGGEDPPGWKILLGELEAEKKKLKLHAEAAMRVFGLPMLDPEQDDALTRRKGPPTVPLLVLSAVNQLPDNRGWLLTAPDQSTTTVSDFAWSLPAARFLHKWLVRVPRWHVPREAPKPPWLSEHISPDAVVACLEDDGRLRFGDASGPASYHRDFGVFADRPEKAHPEPEPWSEDDDEFDP